MMIPVALIQAGFSVGNVAFNVARIAVFYRMAVIAKAQLVVFSEMAITGYPPEDLVLSAQFQDRSMAALVECAAMTADGPAMLIGSLWREDGALYNAVFLLENGKIAARQYKTICPIPACSMNSALSCPGSCRNRWSGAARSAPSSSAC